MSIKTTCQRDHKMLFRYPGGKTKIVKMLCDVARTQVQKLRPDATYVEPFVGAGTATIPLLKCYQENFTSVILNDVDYGVYSVWKAVYKHQDRLIKAINNFKPTIKNFYRIHEKFQLEDYYSDDFVGVGVEKIALHAMSARGLGCMSGGPNGGRDQEGKEKVDTRWNPGKIINSIMFANYLLASFNVTILNKKFEKVDFPENSFLFLDPPDLVTGNSLYQHGMSINDHRALANMLRAKNSWLLSYGSSSAVKKLYEDFAHLTYVMPGYKYSVAQRSVHGCKNMLIRPKV